MKRMFSQVGSILNNYIPEMYKCKLFKNSQIQWIDDQDSITTEGIENYTNLKKLKMTKIYNPRDIYKLSDMNIEEISFPNISTRFIENALPEAKINYDLFKESNNAKQENYLQWTQIGSCHVETNTDSLILFNEKQNVGIRTSKPNASLHVNGGHVNRIKSVNKDYKVTIDDYIIVVISGSPTITLPAPYFLSVNGHIFIIKNNGPGLVTINSDGDEADFLPNDSMYELTEVALKPGDSNTFSNIDGSYCIIQH
jgi:hypothetical protein